VVSTMMLFLQPGGAASLMDTVPRHRFGVGDDWTRRALSSDARVRSRGDILPATASGKGTYPRFFHRASGAHIWDVDGNRYVDYQLGYGPVVLGHADPRVTAAVVAELANGNCIAPLWSTRQVELNELLTDVIPGAELAYLLKTGSDATSAAVRLARIYTGRDKVIRWGYNGWHDWASGNPAGIPEATRANTLVFDYFELDSLVEAFKLNPDQVACVLMMPFGDDVAPAGHLEAIRQIAHSHGALFVLDEMRSGFRLSLGGAQEHLGVQADVSTFSKAMANGHPISAVVGRADVLDRLASTRISSTFFADPAAMVAALTTISILRDTDAIDHLWKIGSALQEGLRNLVAHYDLPAEVVGYPPIPFLRFTHVELTAREHAARAFVAETTRRGLLLHPEHQWFVSAAHTMEDIEFTLDACNQAFAALPDIARR
jgi:glutamate-1-semialdehyde 2,1-aminomutase